MSVLARLCTLCGEAKSLCHALEAAWLSFGNVRFWRLLSIFDENPANGLRQRPRRYQRPVPEVTSRDLSVCLPLPKRMRRCFASVFASLRSVFSFGNGLPFCAGRPRVCSCRCSGGAKRLAFRRSRVMRVAVPGSAAASV